MKSSAEQSVNYRLYKLQHVHCMVDYNVSIIWYLEMYVYVYLVHVYEATLSPSVNRHSLQEIEGGRGEG